MNDLNELDELWEHYGIRFIKKVKYGIKVEGNESQIRSALLEALKRAGGRQKVTISNIQNHFTAVLECFFILLQFIVEMYLKHIEKNVVIC